jgi:hypothetical protein
VDVSPYVWQRGSEAYDPDVKGAELSEEVFGGPAALKYHKGDAIWKRRGELNRA